MGNCSFWKSRNIAVDAKSSLIAVDDSDKAILDLKVQRDDIVKYRRRVEVQARKAQEAAKGLVVGGKRDQAMLALRKKKSYEQVIVDCKNQLTKLEELIGNIEFATVQKDVVGALADGVKCLKRLQEETGGADYINSLMDECADAIETQREISEALARSGIPADDEDALAEFNRLLEEQAMAQRQFTLTADPPVVETKSVVETSAIPRNEAKASKQPEANQAA